MPRYVKVKVLEEFLDNNVKDFGRDRSIEVRAGFVYALKSGTGVG